MVTTAGEKAGLGAHEPPAVVRAGDGGPLLPRRLLRQLDRLTLVGRRPRRGAMQGERRSPRRGRGIEFTDFRPYAPGDDLRQIDWNAYARLDRFFLKLFVEDEDTTLHLLVDTSRSMAWGTPSKLRFAAQVAAATGYIALSNLDWVGLAPFADNLLAPPRSQRGRSSAPRLFSALERLEAGGTTDLGEAMGLYVATARRRGPMLVLSDLCDPTWRVGLRAAVGAGYDVTLVHVLSPEEIAPDVEGDLRLLDDETGQPVDVSVDGDTMTQYTAALDAWRHRLAAWCRRRQVPFVPVATDYPLEELVMEVLRRQGVVA